MSEKKILSADDIFAAEDIQTCEVDVPEWGGTVVLKMLTGEQMIAFWEKNKKSESEAMANLIAMSAVKPDGSPLFTEEQVSRLKKKSFKAMTRLQDAALKLNGLKDKDKQEESVKNG